MDIENGIDHENVADASAFVVWSSLANENEDLYL